MIVCESCNKKIDNDDMSYHIINALTYCDECHNRFFCYDDDDEYDHADYLESACNEDLRLENNSLTDLKHKGVLV